MINIIIVDLEDTLSDAHHRDIWQPQISHQWHCQFMSDKPNQILIDLIDSACYEYVIVTSKPIDYKDLVDDWVEEHLNKKPLDIRMRPVGNFDTSPVLKEAILFELVQEYRVVLAIDDRDDVLAMYRRFHIPTLKFKRRL